MSYSEKQCRHCNATFVGDSRTVFCGDHCRWRYYSHVNYEKRKEAAKAMPKEPRAPKDPEAQARGRSNRAKGARVEREVCHLIQQITGDEVRRNLSQTRDAGGDVKWGPFYLEVKYQQNLALPAWQRQALASAVQDGNNLLPAVVYRRAGEKFWISLRFEDFLMLFDGLRKAAQAAQGAAQAPKG